MWSRLAARPRVRTGGCSSRSRTSSPSPASRRRASRSASSTRPSLRTIILLFASMLPARALLLERGEALVALLAQVPGEFGVDVVEEGLHRRFGRSLDHRDGGVDLVHEFLAQR